MARAAGIERAALLSGRGEPAARLGELAFLEALPGSDVLRCAWFDQNFTEGLLAPAVAAGVWSLPAPAHVVEPFVDADDIADCAIRVLTGDRLGGVHELTGPVAISMDEVAATLSAATGGPVRYEPVTLDEFAATLEELGIPSEDAIELAHAFAEHLRRPQRRDDERRAGAARPPGPLLRDLRARGVRRRPAAVARRQREVVMGGVRTSVLILATMATGFVTGVFALYGNTLMPGLRATDDRTFVGAFQSIDRAIINPWFLGGGFFGALILAAAAAALHLGEHLAPGAAVDRGRTGPAPGGRDHHGHRQRAAQRRDQGRRRPREDRCGRRPRGVLGGQVGRVELGAGRPRPRAPSRRCRSPW